jgi:hypothetical protein
LTLALEGAAWGVANVKSLQQLQGFSFPAGAFRITFREGQARSSVPQRCVGIGPREHDSCDHNSQCQLLLMGFLDLKKSRWKQRLFKNSMLDRPNRIW